MAWQRGANGFLPKNTRRAEFLRAIRRAAAGKSVWTRPQMRQVAKLGSMPEQQKTRQMPLSQRELEVLRRVAEGMVNEEIGEELAIDVETVKKHVKHILDKIGMEDRTQAAIWAVRGGIV
jgi:NarL family two-component system response regulator LiaR